MLSEIKSKSFKPFTSSVVQNTNVPQQSYSIISKSVTKYEKDYVDEYFEWICMDKAEN